MEPPGSGPRIATNAANVLRRVATEAHLRVPPTIEQAQDWHRRLYDAISRPFDYYAGEVRDSDKRFGDLIGYEVTVGGAFGVPSAHVPEALSHFEQAAQQGTAALDVAITQGRSLSALTPPELQGVLLLCASLHGEWVRIHPFANGNGRTARLWANWAAVRYGLPPFVTIRPRPGQPYAAAAHASMAGNHQMTLAVFTQMLRALLGSLPPSS